jgi:hypothetical protein
MAKENPVEAAASNPQKVDKEHLRSLGFEVEEFPKKMDDSAAMFVEQRIAKAKKDGKKGLVFIFENCEGGEIQASRAIIHAVRSTPIDIVSFAIGNNNNSSAIEVIEAINKKPEGAGFIQNREGKLMQEHSTVFNSPEGTPQGFIQKMRGKFLNWQRKAGLNILNWGRRASDLASEKAHSAAQAVKKGIVREAVSIQEFHERMKTRSEEYDEISSTIYRYVVTPIRSGMRGIFSWMQEGGNTLARNLIAGVR